MRIIIFHTNIKSLILSPDILIIILVLFMCFAFAKNRKRPTITQLKETSLSIGQRNKLSILDIKGINRLYCHNYTSDCVDKNEQCSEFALKLCNDVERREWMVENCAGRCKVCYGGINCEDKYDQTIRKPRCPSWAKYCTWSATKHPSLSLHSIVQLKIVESSSRSSWPSPWIQTTCGHSPHL